MAAFRKAVNLFVDVAACAKYRAVPTPPSLSPFPSLEQLDFRSAIFPRASIEIGPREQKVYREYTNWGA
jgi:hypothetical protein